jgi:hypothetical protein
MENKRWKKSSQILKDFSTYGWDSIINPKQTPEQIRESLFTTYKIKEVGAGVYPADFPKKPKLGMRYTVSFMNGQMLSIVVGSDGEIIERTYSDKGDIHLETVIKLVRGWQKAISQAQRGGRPKGTIPQRVKQTYNRIINLRFSQAWMLRTDTEFLKAYPEYNRSKLARAKKWNAKGKP